ncbi:MAG: hypothetical protein IT384_34015 [Deltaproteobacteria bacterium]|nr:hypothetical protein [Deltaproteobacteria bacterium]
MKATDPRAALEAIQRLREFPPDSATETHLAVVKERELSGRDLAAFQRAVLEGSWSERSPAFLAYEAEVTAQVLARAERDPSFNVAGDPQATFAAYLRHHIVNRGVLLRLELRAAIRELLAERNGAEAPALDALLALADARELDLRGATVLAVQPGTGAPRLALEIGGMVVDFSLDKPLAMPALESYLSGLGDVVLVELPLERYRAAGLAAAGVPRSPQEIIAARAELERQEALIEAP